MSLYSNIQRVNVAKENLKETLRGIISKLIYRELCKQVTYFANFINWMIRIL